jgi:DNA (cytosine-5)-methyltransferase 1
MAWHYKRNHNPRHYFLCPIRDLLTADLPEELFGIDILDGSPPCSTFSMAGSREDAWGKDKVFREGQAKQVLSDLFFDWIALVGRLKPKVAIAENVKGMLIGNAKGYTRMVVQELDRIGYRAQVFLVNAADCGVPQRRERVFFACARKDIDLPPLALAPKSRWVSAIETSDAGTDRDERVRPPSDLKWGTKTALRRCVARDRQGVVVEPKLAGMARPRRLAPSGPVYALVRVSYADTTRWIRIGSFPDDYNFGMRGSGSMIGISVPPKMTGGRAGGVLVSGCSMARPSI